MQSRGVTGVYQFNIHQTCTLIHPFSSNPRLIQAWETARSAERLTVYLRGIGGDRERASPLDAPPRGAVFRFKGSEREGCGMLRVLSCASREDSNCAASCDQEKCGAVAPIFLDRGGFVA